MLLTSEAGGAGNGEALGAAGGADLAGEALGDGYAAGGGEVGRRAAIRTGGLGGVGSVFSGLGGREGWGGGRLDLCLLTVWAFCELTFAFRARRRSGGRLNMTSSTFEARRRPFGW